MKNKVVIWGIIFLALIASLVVAFDRYTDESNYKNVELILDYDEVYKFCLNNGLDFNKTLSLFKNKGISTIAFNEDTLETLCLENKIFILPANERLVQENFKSVYSGATYISVPLSDDFNDLKKRFLFFLGSERIRISERNRLVEIKGFPKDLFEQGIGISESEIIKALKLGFNVILRPQNKGFFQNQQIKEYWYEIYTLSKLKQDNFKVTGVIFGGLDNEVLGYPAYLNESCKYLKGCPGFLGAIETYTSAQVQKGINTLASSCPDKVVRVQAISEAYLAKLNPKLAKEIFLLGVKERNIRWAYLHLFNSAFYKQDVLNTNLSFVSNLAQSLKDRGFRISPVAIWGGFETRSWSQFADAVFIFIITLAVLVVFLAIINEWIRLSSIWQFIIVILGLLVLGVFYKTGNFLLARKLIALLAGLVFSIFGLITGVRYLQGSKADLGAKSKNSFFNELKLITLAFLYISIISIIGGFLVQAILAKTAFFMQIDKFRGVKLLMVLPPIVVLIWYITKGCEFSVSLKEVLSWPVRFWQFILGLIIILGGIIYIWRTGNITDTPQVTWERGFRFLLDKWLGVRPRFKEIFLAHPVLILSCSQILRKENLGLGILLFIASIGQVDIIDSFAHLHTSLAITLTRVFYGIVLGWLIGILIWIILRIGLVFYKRLSQ